jgi:hypothetical protein
VSTTVTPSAQQLDRTPAAPATRRGPSPTRVRLVLRTVHLVIGVVLATYVYLPATMPGHEVIRWALMVVGVPLVTVTGLVIWKQAAVRRLLARRR